MRFIITTNKNKANFLVLFFESYLAYSYNFSYIGGCYFMLFTLSVWKILSCLVFNDRVNERNLNCYKTNLVMNYPISRPEIFFVPSNLVPMQSEIILVIVLNLVNLSLMMWLSLCLVFILVRYWMMVKQCY